jgi:hypothetical protein
MMEDMKGKIRVYARCRPFAKYVATSSRSVALTRTLVRLQQVLRTTLD